MLLRSVIVSLIILVSLAGSGPAMASWQDDYASGQQALLYRDYAAAERHLIAALDKAESFGASDDRLARTLNELARTYRLQRNFAKAEPLLERAIVLFDKGQAPDSPELAEALVAAAEVRASLHDAKSAQPLAQRALTIRERQLGPAHPAVADTLDLLAGIQIRQHDMSAAEEALNRALEIRENSFGPQHRSVASSLDRLAALHIAGDRLAEAEPLLARAMRIRQRTLGPDHPDNAKSFDSLAQLHLARGDHAKAKSMLAKGLDLRRAALGRNHLQVADSLTSLAALSRSERDYAAALSQLADARDIRTNIMGANHPDVARDRRNIAELERLQQVAAQPAAEPQLLASNPQPSQTGTAAAPTILQIQQAAARAIARAPRADPVAADPVPIASVPAASVPAASVPAASVPASPVPVAPSAGPALQLASFKSQKTAAAEWQRIRASFPQLLAGQELNLQRIDLGERGIFYRVRTGPFTDLASAKAACTHMRDQKQDCLVITR